MLKTVNVYCNTAVSDHWYLLEARLFKLKISVLL